MRKGFFRGLLLSALVVLLIGVFTGQVRAQDRGVTRSWGLSASLQSGQMDILVPLWMGNTFVIAPGVSVNYVEHVTTNIGVMLVPRLYLDMRRVSPYITAVVGFDFNMPNIGSDTTDLTLGIGLGGEYFVNPKFSFAVEGRVVGMVFDISGLRNTAVMTSGAVVANVYF